jgi:predicted amidohydrolase
MALMGAELILYPTAIGSEPQNPNINSKLHWQTGMTSYYYYYYYYYPSTITITIITIIINIFIHLLITNINIAHPHHHHHRYAHNYYKSAMRGHSASNYIPVVASNRIGFVKIFVY